MGPSRPPPPPGALSLVVSRVRTVLIDPVYSVRWFGGQSGGSTGIGDVVAADFRRRSSRSDRPGPLPAGGSSFAEGEDIGIRTTPAPTVGYGESSGLPRPLPSLPGLPPVATRRILYWPEVGEFPEQHPEVPIFRQRYGEPEITEVGGGLPVPSAPPQPVALPPPEELPEIEADFEKPEENTVAVDWGQVAAGALGGLIGTNPMQYAPTFVPPAATTRDQWHYGVDSLGRPTGPNGKPRCRRRRRRLLTPTDLSDLAALQALVGKGSTALNMAVAKAVRR